MKTASLPDGYLGLCCLAIAEIEIENPTGIGIKATAFRWKQTALSRFGRAVNLCYKG